MKHLHKKLVLVGQICKINCSLDHIDLIAIFGFAKSPTIFSPWRLKCIFVYWFMWKRRFFIFFYQFKWIIKNVLESDFIIISRATPHQDFYPKFDPHFYFFVSFLFFFPWIFFVDFGLFSINFVVFFTWTDIKFWALTKIEMNLPFKTNVIFF